MPIEIRELIIKAFVGQTDAGKNNKGKQDECDSKENILQESMEQFSEILKQEKER